jgi:hypothetical protein
MKRHDRYALAGCERLENDHSFAAAGAVDDAEGCGAIWTGAAATGARFGEGGFLAAATAGEAVAAAGRGAGTGASWTGAAGGEARAVDDAGPLPGSGVMILTGGVEAADGKSALVGLPVGIDPGSAATSPVDAAATGGAFHDGE